MEISDDQVLKDASDVFEVITREGIAIVPLDVAYAIIGYIENAIKNLPRKKRSLEKSWPS